MQYTQDYDELYPYSYQTTPTAYQMYPYLLQPYLKSLQIFNCPSDSTTPPYDGVSGNEGVSYGMSVFFDGDRFYYGLPPVSLASLPKPSQTVLIADTFNFRAAPKGYSTYPANRLPLYRHLETCNVLFADGHVKAMRENQLQEKAAIEDGITLTGNDQFLLWNFY